jgi:glucosamine--fructose-6-phosphate aminotransferase (isomerizing)
MSPSDTTITAMAREIAEVPAAATRLLASSHELAGVAKNIRAYDPRFAVICGRGSSGHVGMFLRYLIELNAGVLVSFAAPSVVTSYRRAHDMRQMLFVVISQSGRSPDLIASTEQARRSGALTVALVNDATSPVADAAELVVPIEAGLERSVAATKTVALSMLQSVRLVAHLTDDEGLLDGLAQLPRRFEAALSCDWSAWSSQLATARAAFVIARGYALGTAREIALKLNETMQLPAAGYSAAEFRHGPLAAVTAQTPVLALSSREDAARSVDDLLRDIAGRGRNAYAAGGADGTLPWIGDDHPACDAIAMLLPAYLAIERAARAQGFDPDRPASLVKVTETF